MGLIFVILFELFSKRVFGFVTEWGFALTIRYTIRYFEDIEALILVIHYIIGICFHYEFTHMYNHI